MSERDTHFAGFAKLLWDELEDLKDNMEPDFSYQSYERFAQKFISRRAYDLVHYTLLQAVANRPTGLYADFIREHVPDLTAWFEQKEE